MRSRTTVGSHPEQTRAIVVYDSKTGSIVHCHQDVTYKGGHFLPDEEFANRAVTLAREVRESRQVAVPKALATLRVDPEMLATGRRCRVDLRTKVLIVESEQTTRGSPRRSVGRKPGKRQATKK
jgi:hypothetical protein